MNDGKNLPSGQGNLNPDSETDSIHFYIEECSEGCVTTTEHGSSDIFNTTVIWFYPKGKTFFFFHEQ